MTDSDLARAAPRAIPSALVSNPRALFAVDAVVIAVALAAVTVLRINLLYAGRDLDGDSVGHAYIARQFLVQPDNILIHWVWLPLWHVVHAFASWLGGGLELVRRWNVALSLAPPWILYATLRSRIDRLPAPASVPMRVAERALPALAAVLLALWPLEIPLGESGQPEILFQTLVLLGCLAWERDHGALAGLALAPAAVLRYEAWLLPPVFLALWLMRRPRRPLDALAWILPGATAAAWCLLHYKLTGEPLQFLRMNREYVADALTKLHATWREGHGPVYIACFYLAIVPFRSVGWLLTLAVPGAVWYARRAPRSHQLVLLALLGFVSYGWIRAQHLGLARHFVAVIPFYATMMAAGALALAAVAAERLPSGSRGLEQQRKVQASLVVAAGCALLAAFVAWHVMPRARDLFVEHARAFASERETARVVVGAAAGGETVFCDSSRVEVYTNLPFARFVRDPVRDLDPARVIAAAATARSGSALVATERAHATPGLRAVADVLYEDTTFVVLRVRARRPGA